MADRHIRTLLSQHAWCRHPIVTLAPMRHTSGPDAALAVSAAGGIGFMHPQITREALFADFETASTLLKTRYATLSKTSPTLMPLGVGFVMWGAKLVNAAAAVKQYRPAIVWLYAGHGGQDEINEWTSELRKASEGTKVWLMIGTLKEAEEAVASQHQPDALVVQGAEAGGHARFGDGSSWTTLLPEVADVAPNIPLVAAGGIVDGRGVAAGLSIGAAAIAMGTRFLACEEARISKGYQDAVLHSRNGASSTTQSLIWNHLMGNYEWPKGLAPRGLINQSYVEHQAGVPFEELQTLHDQAKATGDAAWGVDGRAATYAGTGVGLVRQVKTASAIVEEVRTEASAIIRSLSRMPLPETSQL